MPEQTHTEDPFQLLLEEVSQLDQRVMKLEKELKGNLNMPVHMGNLMKVQLSIMKCYQQVLGARIVMETENRIKQSMQ